MLQRNSADRRTQRTRKALQEALISLMFEKSYDAILIQEILDRANIGRSTFYTHFRDKDELLVEGLQNLRSMLRDAQLATPGLLARAGGGQDQGGGLGHRTLLVRAGDQA